MVFEEAWLPRFFDRIRLFEVSHVELERIRVDFPLGRRAPRIEEVESIERLRERRRAGFETELADWHARGQFDFVVDEGEDGGAGGAGAGGAEIVRSADWLVGSSVVESPRQGSVRRVDVALGDTVEAGRDMAIRESMQMEIPVPASVAGHVAHLTARDGQHVVAGQALVVVEPS